MKGPKASKTGPGYHPPFTASPAVPLRPECPHHFRPVQVLARVPEDGDVACLDSVENGVALDFGLAARGGGRGRGHRAV